jgi:cysteine synthase B
MFWPGGVPRSITPILTEIVGIEIIGSVVAAALAIPAIRTCAAGSLLEHIGNTPLLRLERIAEDLPGVEIYGKAEFFNPGGSVKDRAALNMIVEGERSGALTQQKVLLDSTSGNTGIAYAMICAAHGYKVKLCLPLNASPERKRILKAYGAEIVFTDPGEGSDGAIRKCKEIYAADPERYFYPDQYSNPANWKAHYNTTAVEILAQTERRITHFVAAMGTSGTFMGVTRRLKHELPEVKCVSAQPASGFHGLEGLKHMPTAIVPAIYDPHLADDNIWIETEDAFAMVRRTAREEGLLVGISSGANLVAARKIGKRLVDNGERGVIVTILCDGAEKYLSEEFWND